MKALDPPQQLVLPDTAALRARGQPASVLLIRFGVWGAAAAAAASIDLWTKFQSHPVVYHHYNHIAATTFVALALCLFAFAMYRSRLTALACGLYCGALVGNDGELLVHGYATDWIVVGDRVTNLADLCVLAGLILLVSDLFLSMRRARSRPRRRHSIRLTTVFALACGAITGLALRDFNVALIVAIIVDMEARVVVWLGRRYSPSGS